MGNPTKKFKDFRHLRGKFDGDDPIMRGLKTAGNSRSAHNQRVANTPEWTKNDASIRAVLLRAFPKMNTNPTQRQRAGRWAFIIQYYFRLSFTTLHVAMLLPHGTDKPRPSAEAPLPLAAKLEEMKRRTKIVEDTVARILRVAKGLRTDKKPRSGKMGRPRKV